MAQAVEIAKQVKAATVPTALMSASIGAGASHSDWAPAAASKVTFLALTGLGLGLVWFVLIFIHRLTRAEFLSGLDS